MCGLCGAFGNITFKEKLMMRNLQLFSQLRGVDSTGIAIANQSHNAKVDIIKSLGGFESLISSSDKFNDDWTVKEFSLRLLMGHHRKATIGDITLDNAHPFQFKNIVGCHNGTVQKHTLTKFSSYDTKKIDSHIILEEIARSNLNVRKVFKQLDGAWAITFFDNDLKELHMIRNDRRPLYFCFNMTADVIFWASEGWMLSRAAKLENVKLQDDGKIRLLKPEAHVVWRIEKNKITVSVDDKIKPKTSGNVVPLPKQTNACDTSKDIFVEQYAPGYNNNYITRKEFEELTKSGCIFCKDPITWEQRKEILWLDEDECCCISCKLLSEGRGVSNAN